MHHYKSVLNKGSAETIQASGNVLMLLEVVIFSWNLMGCCKMHYCQAPENKHRLYHGGYTTHVGLFYFLDSNHQEKHIGKYRNKPCMLAIYWQKFSRQKQNSHGTHTGLLGLAESA